VFSYYRMCSHAIECVLVMHKGLISAQELSLFGVFIAECTNTERVLILSKVFFFYALVLDQCS